MDQIEKNRSAKKLIKNARREECIIKPARASIKTQTK